MDITVTVHVTIAGRPLPIANVEVELSVAASGGGPTRARTGADGVATFHVTLPPMPLGITVPVPVVATVLGATGEPVGASSRIGGGPVEIAVSLDAAIDHGIAPHRPTLTDAESHARAVAGWAKRFADPGPGGVVDACLARTVLDAVAGLANPKSELQQAVATRVRQRLGGGRHGLPVNTAAVLTRVAAVAASARAALDASGVLPDTGKCSAARPIRDIARDFITGSPTLQRALDSACTHDPPPAAASMPAKAGTPFAMDFRWDSKCALDYETGQLSPEVREQMGRWYPDAPRVIAAPRVHAVQVYNYLTQQITRDAEPRTGILRTHTFDGADWIELTTQHVALDDTSERGSVALVPDPAAPSRQALIIDVLPGLPAQGGRAEVRGEQIVLSGSGFIAEEMTVMLEHVPWKAELDQDRLVPDGALSPVVPWYGAKTARVVGGQFPHEGFTADTYAGDSIVFDWPLEASSPGLYRLSFTTPNLRDDKGRPYALDLKPQVDTCEIDPVTPETLATPPIYFAVLPRFRERAVDVVARTVKCERRMRPEVPLFFDWFDDVRYAGHLEIEQTQVSVSGAGDCTLGISSTTPADPDRSGEHDFRHDGDTWDPSLHLLPDGMSTRVLGLDELLICTLTADELFDPLMKLVIKVALVAVLLTVIILVTVALLDLAVIAGLAFGLVFGVGTAGVGVAAAGVIEAALVFLAPIVVMLAGAFFVGGVAAINGLVDSMSQARPLVHVTPMFHGLEVALRSSPLRWQRQKWTLGRPGDLGGGVSVDRVSFAPDRVTEVYRGGADGGSYTLELDLDLV